MPDDEREQIGRGAPARFSVPHRGGTRVEVSEPIHVGGDRPWLCAVKLVGRKRDDVDPAEGEPTQTLLVRTGRGETPEDARRDALAQLTLVYGSPVEPPPTPVIVDKPSDPAPPPQPPPARARSSWLSRLIGRLRGE